MSELARFADLDLALRTRRLALRPLGAADADDLWPYVSDESFPRFMGWVAHRDRGETAAFLAAVEENRALEIGMVWAIRQEGALAGLMGLEGITRAFRAWQADRAELGYWIGPPFQGRGFATEAGREVLRWGFAALRLHKVNVSCIRDNEASRRVIEKLGFRPVGVRRDHMYRHGRWWDQLDFELCADEWRP